MKAYELDREIRVFRAKLRDSGGMQSGQLGLDRRDIAPRADAAQDGAQPVPERRGIRDSQRRAWADMPATIGRDRRDIDAVKRGAAHQPQRLPQFCAR